MPKQKQYLNELPKKRQKHIFLKLLQDVDSKFFDKSLQNNINPNHLNLYYDIFKSYLEKKVNNGSMQESLMKKKLKYARAVVRTYRIEYNKQLNNWAAKAMKGYNFASNNQSSLLSSQLQSEIKMESDLNKIISQMTSCTFTTNTKEHLNLANSISHLKLSNKNTSKVGGKGNK